MSWLIGKDSDAGRDWGQEKKGTTEDEMAGWHHWLDGRESEWTPGVGDGQGGLACCNSRSRKESDMTERLIWSDLNVLVAKLNLQRTLHCLGKVMPLGHLQQVEEGKIPKEGRLGHFCILKTFKGTWEFKNFEPINPDVSIQFGRATFFLHLGLYISVMDLPNYWGFQFSSVTQLCPTLCDPMNHRTPGLPVHHQLLEFTQTHVHRVGDAIQPFHPLSSPSPPAPNPSQHQSLFQ